MVKHLRFFLTTLLLAVFSGASRADEVALTLEDGVHDGSAITWTTDYATVVQNKGTGSAVNSNYIAAPRIYIGNYLTVSAADGYYVTGLTMTCSSSSYCGDSLVAGTTVVSDYVVADESFTVTTDTDTKTITVSTTAEGLTAFYLQNLKSSTASSNVQLRPTAITVSYAAAAADAVSAPTITPSTGTYYGEQTVSIEGEEGAAIQYSLNGGDYETYTEPFTVSETTTIKATQTVDGKESNAATATLTIAPNYTDIATMNAAATSTSTAMQLTLPEEGWLVTYGNGRYTYLTDGSKAALVYSSSSAMTAKAGDIVTGTITGSLTLYNSMPEVVYSSASLTTLSEGNEVSATAVDAATLAASFTDYANQLVTVRCATLGDSLEVTGSTVNTVFTVGDVSFTVRNTFGLSYSAAPGDYHITAIVGGVYSSANQLYPVSEDFLTEVVNSDLSVGDEVTVNGGKYTVASENLFVNGSFENGVSGWKTIGYTTDAVESNFTVTMSGGYDGGAYITTNGGGVGSETTLRQSVAVEEGSTYLFAIHTSGTTPADNNLQYNALFQMTDSATENGVLSQFNWASGSSAEWTETNAIVTAAEGNPYMGVRFGWNSGSSFDGVQLYKVEFAGVDDSELTALIATAKETLATYDESDDWYASLSEAITAAETAEITTAEEIAAAVTALQTALDDAANEAAMAEARANAPYEDGDYYILNEETGYYVGGGNSWGTQASLLERPQTFTFTLQNDGSYLLTSIQGGVCLGSNCYVDANSGYYTTWTLSGGESGYALVNTAGNYLMANETGAALTIETLDDASTATLWKLVSVTEGMDEATVEAPVDVTGLVKNPDFKRGGSSYWTATSYDGTESAGNYTYKSSASGYMTTNIIESWRSSNGFKLQQTLTGLPAGLYGLSGQGFYHNYDESVDSTLSELYADEEANVMPLRDDDTMTNLANAYNYMVEDATKWAIDVVYFRVNEGDTINIGVRKEGTYGWTTFTHAKLIYLGDNSLITNVLTDLADSLQTTLEAAKALTEQEVSDQSTQEALAAVIAEAEADDYLLTAKRSTVEATLAALAEAMAAVEASIVDTPDGVSGIEAETGESDYGYTLSGARAVKGTRGIVIQNGKKTVVK